MSQQPEWPVAFFDDDYLRIYRPTFTPERTAAEVDFIEGALALARGAAVLDLACGYGRHAIGMAARGYRTTGVDFNPRYLAIAAAEAAGAGVEVAWRPGDMRALAFRAEFDGVYSFFTSFGYYDDADNERVLAGVAAALRPGGRFLLDIVNRDHILVHPNLRTWAQRDDGGLFVEEVSIELAASRVVSKQMLLDPQGGTQVTKRFSLRAYTCAELAALMARHGLAVRETWGGYGREPFGTEARRLVLVSERAT